jgi:ABC-type nitrate/sulfonate/bicarbonate transport system permease component
MFASIIMMSVLGWLMFLFVSLLERLMMPWNFLKERVDA